MNLFPILLQAQQEPENGSGMFLSGFLIAIAIISFYIIKEYIRYISGNIRSKAIDLLKLKPRYKDVLAQKFTFYQKLNEKEKNIFEKRVQFFINLKEFIPRGIPEVTDEMKALIAGSAIQLTFGLPKIYFSHFDKILVYPGEYFSLLHRRNHKGEVNAQVGAIVLSWKNFEEGYIDPEDSINLGLHEMAHALRLENVILNDEYNFLDEKVLERWDQLAEQEIIRIRNGESEFFRKYACSNKHEFFAVAVENFFERPQKLYDHQPELYNTMAKLLRQDTLQMSYR